MCSVRLKFSPLVATLKWPLQDAGLGDGLWSAVHWQDYTPPQLSPILRRPIRIQSITFRDGLAAVVRILSISAVMNQIFLIRQIIDRHWILFILESKSVLASFGTQFVKQWKKNRWWRIYWLNKVIIRIIFFTILHCFLSKNLHIFITT